VSCDSRWAPRSQPPAAGDSRRAIRRLGLLAAAHGDRDAAERHLRDALRLAETTGLRLFETQAREALEALPA
jgi:hypothetical protein